MHRDLQARTVFRFAQFDAGTMPVGDAFDDRQTQAAAGRAGLGAAVEAVEHSGPFFQWNAGSGIANAQHDFMGTALDAYIHPLTPCPSVTRWMPATPRPPPGV